MILGAAPSTWWPVWRSLASRHSCRTDQAGAAERESARRVDGGEVVAQQGDDC